jgi:hypothetical protein
MGHHDVGNYAVPQEGKARREKERKEEKNKINCLEAFNALTHSLTKLA